MSESNRTPPRARPFVTLNIAGSVDGKVALADGGKVIFVSPGERARIEALRASPTAC
jgi:riboflavin biosynthesis pyrimidine reductase